MWAVRFIQAWLKISPFIKEIGDNIKVKYNRPQYINIPSLKETYKLVETIGLDLIEVVPTDNTSTDPNFGVCKIVCVKI